MENKVREFLKNEETHQFLRNIYLQKLLDELSLPEIKKRYKDLIVAIAKEVFIFKQTLKKFEENGLLEKLEGDYEGLQIIGKRLEELLKIREICYIDLTGKKVDNELADIVDAIEENNVESEVVVKTIEPAVLYKGKVIHYGKVIISKNVKHQNVTLVSREEKL